MRRAALKQSIPNPSGRLCSADHLEAILARISSAAHDSRYPLEQPSHREVVILDRLQRLVKERLDDLESRGP